MRIGRNAVTTLSMLAFLVITVGALCFGGCSGGGGSSNSGGPGDSGSTSVHLSGTISTSSPATGLRSLSTAPTLTTTEVWALPIAKMQGASIDKMNYMLRKTTTPDASGNFSFDLKKTISLAEIIAQYPGVKTDGMPTDTVFDVDWMLVQMTDTTPINVIALPGDTNYDSLLSIPLSAFTQADLNIGAVDPASGLASFPVSSMANDVTLSSSSLQAMARADSILATIKDVIRNCDMNNSKCVSGRQSFVFMGDYSQLVTSYATATSYSGYQLYLDLTDYFNSTDFDSLCGTAIAPSGTSFTAALEYKLTPPVSISILSGITPTTYSPANPITTGTIGTMVSRNTNTNNEGTSTYIDCFDSGGNNPIYLRKNVNNVNDWLLQFITGDQPGYLIKDASQGDWILSRVTGTGSTNIATFQFALGNPVDAGGNPIVFVPGVQIDTDGGSPAAVTTVHVKWYQWNGSAYVEVTDTALLTSLLGSFSLAVEDFNGITGSTERRAVHLNGQSFSTASFDVTNPSDGKGSFYYNYGAEDRYALQYCGIDYSYGGQSFRFAWSKPF